MNKTELITYREGREGDMPFIFRSILLGTYHGNKPAKGWKHDSKAPVDFFSSISQDVFMKGYHAYLSEMFQRPSVKIIVACLIEDPDVILGFSVYEQELLHFVFVKPQWRKIGIGRDLTPKTTTTVTGFTRVGDSIRRKKGWGFNPWS